MIIDVFPSVDRPSRVLVMIHTEDGKNIVSEYLTSSAVQELAEQLLVIAARVRCAEASENQPDLFAVADLLAGRI